MIRATVQRLVMKQRWFLAIRRRDNPFTTDNYRLIQPPRDRFYADPFLLRRGKTSYLFFEDYRYTLGRGLISCSPLGEDGTPLPARVVLDTGHHVSYPHVFEWSREVWMIPETSCASQVRLYRCVEFPWRWTLETVLLRDRICSDSTLFNDGESWWMFTSELCDPRSPHAALCLYRAASPLGPWQAHPFNPVVFDRAGARPAGALFHNAGAVLRPSQDCSRTYGGGIRFSRVEALSPQQYRETPVSRIGTAWLPGLQGAHTYNCDARFEVLDGYVLRTDLYTKWLSVAASLRNSVSRTREELWTRS
jgi:hypothetical protein